MAVSSDVYRKLARHLDRLPGGFPATSSGVELRILQRLFTPQEAELALHLTMLPERVGVIARRAHLAPAEAARRLEEMARKGLIYRLASEGRTPHYSAAQFVVGIWEYHVNSLDPELIRDMEEYMPALAHEWAKAPQLRTIPVGESISTVSNVLPYERAEELVRMQTRFLVAPCICRRERRIMGEGCTKPEETCLVFGVGAEYYHQNGLGRFIDLQETLDILKQADAAGLVLQPSNLQHIFNICCCCGCCCGVLRNARRMPRPSDYVASAFVASANVETCAGCGVCVERCQMGALQLADGRVRLDVERCIGCGLCVSTCPTQTLTLQRRPDPPPVPRTIVQASIEAVQKRGKMTMLDLAMLQLRSKLDRLLATRAASHAPPAPRVDSTSQER